MAASMERIREQLKGLPVGKDARSKRMRRQLFRQIDGNGNGILSLAETDDAVRNKWSIDVPRPVINRAFHAARDLAPPVADFSGDYIDFGEFRVFMVYLRHYYDLFHLYMQIDTSGDGRLGLDEFVKAIPLLQSWGVTGLENPHVSFGQMDRDGGGMVLFDEFAHWGLHQGVSDLKEDATEHAEALELLKNAKANLCSKDEENMKHAKYSVTEGISGQGALAPSKADAGRMMLAAAFAGPGTLVVTVHQATGLRIADRTTSDPYAVLSFGDSEEQTRTIKRDLNPIWNETIRFSNEGDDLEINVFDYDVKSANDFLGRVIISEQTLLSGTGSRKRLALTGPKAQGTIDVSFSFRDRSTAAAAQAAGYPAAQAAPAAPAAAAAKCASGCGRVPFRHFPTCCTHCKGPSGPHARDCDARA